VRALDALDIGQEGVLVRQPLIEGRPGLEQRFMRDFDNRFSSILGCPIGLARCARRQEPRLHQGTDHTQSFPWQLRQPCRLTHPLAVVEPDPHEMRYEGIAQRYKLGIRRLLSADGLIGDQPHRVLDRIEVVLRIAERMVFGQAELLVVAAASVKQPQSVS
jgi:hypothetical protein